MENGYYIKGGLDMYLTCKRLDAIKSFFSRLSKVGESYVKKNDVICIADKKEIKAFDEILPGRHIIQDNIFTNCIYDTLYSITNLDDVILDGMNRVNDTIPELRKSSQIALINHPNNRTTIELEYVRPEDDVHIPICKDIRILKDSTFDPKCSIDYVSDINNLVRKLEVVGNTITTFDEELRGYSDYKWMQIPDIQLISLRNGERLDLKYHWDDIASNGVDITTRLVKPYFVFAGASRLDTPIAEFCEYRVVPTDIMSDVATLQIHAIYSCTKGSGIVIDAIHEYKILLY